MSRRMISQKDQDYVKVLSTAIDADKDGNLQVNGNQTETGNLSVDGIITQKKFELDTELGLNFSAASKGIVSAYYTRARVSNGKLNLVIAITIPGNATTQQTIISGSSLLDYSFLSIPSAILAKLHTTPLENLAAQVQTGISSGLEQKQNIACAIVKAETSIAFNLYNLDTIVQSADPTYGNIIWRFEFNFILS